MSEKINIFSFNVLTFENYICFRNDSGNGVEACLRKHI
nr:MAG TPA: hypothetical protein [Caudoviricetes sp.]